MDRELQWEHSVLTLDAPDGFFGRVLLDRLELIDAEDGWQVAAIVPTYESIGHSMMVSSAYIVLKRPLRDDPPS